MGAVVVLRNGAAVVAPLWTLEEGAAETGGNSSKNSCCAVTDDCALGGGCDTANAATVTLLLEDADRGSMPLVTDNVMDRSLASTVCPGTGTHLLVLLSSQ